MSCATQGFSRLVLLKIGGYRSDTGTSHPGNNSGTVIVSELPSRYYQINLTQAATATIALNKQSTLPDANTLTPAISRQNSHFRSWYKKKVWDSATDNDLRVALRKFFQFLATEKGITNQKAVDALK